MAVDVGEPALDAVVVEGEPGVIEAENAEDRGVEVIDRRENSPANGTSASVARLMSGS